MTGIFPASARFPQIDDRLCHRQRTAKQCARRREKRKSLIISTIKSACRFDPVPAFVRFSLAGIVDLVATSCII
jgi:hypothetical protein